MKLEFDTHSVSSLLAVQANIKQILSIFGAEHNIVNSTFLQHKFPEICGPCKRLSANTSTWTGSHNRARLADPSPKDSLMLDVSESLKQHSHAFSPDRKWNSQHGSRSFAEMMFTHEFVPGCPHLWREKTAANLSSGTPMIKVSQGLISN